jgi:hypothetical protein
MSIACIYNNFWPDVRYAYFGNKISFHFSAMTEIHRSYTCTSVMSVAPGGMMAYNLWQTIGFSWRFAGSCCKPGATTCTTMHHYNEN